MKNRFGRGLGRIFYTGAPYNVRGALGGRVEMRIALRELAMEGFGV
jgi:hypothetical protein